MVAIPRPARAHATDARNGCRIPAPAPWASTYRSRASGGRCSSARRGRARTGAGLRAGVAAAPTRGPRAPRRRTRAAPPRALFRPLQILALPWIDAHALALADEIGHLYGDAVRELGRFRACRLRRAAHDR